MKKTVGLFAIVFAMLIAVNAAASQLDVDGDWHFAPKLGYLDPRDGDLSSDFAWGADVSYQWNQHHEVGLGFLSSSTDVTNTTVEAKNLIWDLGYDYHFNTHSDGNFYLGLAGAEHRIKLLGSTWKKMGAKLDFGYQWESGWLLETSYLFAGKDTLTQGATRVEAKLGGLAIMVGYKF